MLSRDALMENFYNRKATPFDRSIDMHISHLRKKLEDGEALIKTIRGVGYQFCRTPEDAGRRMKSLFAKILLWFWFTLAITVVGSAFISALNVNENASDERAPVARLVTFQLEEARAAYEIGGRPGLQAFLDTLDRDLRRQGHSHRRERPRPADRPGPLRPGTRARGRPYFFQIFRTGDAMVSRAADDGRYWFFFIVPRVRVGSWFLTAGARVLDGGGACCCATGWRCT